MWRTPIVVAVMILLSCHASAKSDYHRLPCKTPTLAPSCFRAHARLRVGNGTPAYRLWPVGTHHIYGIYSNAYGFAHEDELADNESAHMPPAVEKAVAKMTAGWIVYGDFEVCPLERAVEGHMQSACIESAEHVVLDE